MNHHRGMYVLRTFQSWMNRHRGIYFLRTFHLGYLLAEGVYVKFEGKFLVIGRPSVTNAKLDHSDVKINVQNI